MSEQLVSMLKHAQLPAMQKFVLTMMAMYADGSMVCKVGVKTLAEAAGLTPAHLMHIRRELATLEYIKKTDDGYVVCLEREGAVTHG